MKIACTIASLCVLCFGARAQADITITSSATLDSDGHLLDGGTFELKGVIADGTTWGTEFSAVYSFAKYESMQLTISGTGTSYDGTFVRSSTDPNVGYLGRNTLSNEHYFAYDNNDSILQLWTNGIDEIEMIFWHQGSAQDAVIGDLVVESDFSDHVLDSLAGSVVGHLTGSNSFDTVNDSSSWTNTSFSATSAIPEPSTAGYLALGAVGLLATRRRRKTQNVRK